MKAPSTRRLIGIAVGLCISSWASFSLLSILTHTSDISNRSGLVCAFLCSFGLLVYFWAAGSADVIRKLGWSYRACRYVGFAFLLPGSALFLSHGSALSIINFLTVQIIFFRLHLPEDCVSGDFRRTGRCSGAASDDVP
jgi:hypothetical protein